MKNGFLYLYYLVSFILTVFFLFGCAHHQSRCGSIGGRDVCVVSHGVTRV